MGLRNSSKTRVAPVFAALFAKDRTGRLWLPQLLGLGSRSKALDTERDVGTLPEDHPPWWGDNERSLEPPRSLLRWLVCNASPPKNPKSWGSGDTRAKRERLVRRDQQTIREALRLLEERPRRRAWYVLEGESRPDACLQTEHLLLVVEGKRTERGATTSTSWMSGRSQILRHMDAAWDIRNGRRVVGLMVVEGSGPDDQAAIGRHWLRESEGQIAEGMLAASLPHRSADERQALAAGFLGVTTWQAINRAFKLRVL